MVRADRATLFAMPREERRGDRRRAGWRRSSGADLQDNGMGNLLAALLTLCQPYTCHCSPSWPDEGAWALPVDPTISERTEAYSMQPVSLVSARRPHSGRSLGRGDQASMGLRATTHRPVFVLVNLMGLRPPPGLTVQGVLSFIDAAARPRQWC
jgi:hypothetical protein